MRVVGALVAVVLPVLPLTGCTWGWDHSRTVQRSDYADAWPLDADEAVLACDSDGRITLTAGDESEVLVTLNDDGSFSVTTLRVPGAPADEGPLDLIEGGAELCE